MRNTRSRKRVLPLAIASIALMAGATAEAQSFGAKPGAWEMTVTTSGITFPPEALAKLPPDQRALIEKRLAAQGGSAPQVRKSCVKKADLDQDRFMKSQDSACTVKTVSRTSTKLVLQTICPNATQTTTATMSFEAKTPESVVGDIDIKGAASPVHIGVVGKWLGNSCEGIPARPE